MPFPRISASGPPVSSFLFAVSCRFGRSQLYFGNCSFLVLCFGFPTIANHKNLFFSAPETPDRPLFVASRPPGFHSPATNHGGNDRDGGRRLAAVAEHDRPDDRVLPQSRSQPQPPPRGSVKDCSSSFRQNASYHVDLTLRVQALALGIFQLVPGSETETALPNRKLSTSSLLEFHVEDQPVGPNNI